MKTSSSTKPVLAIDIGGTKIMTALFTGDGKLIDRDLIPTLAEQGLEKIVGRLFAAIESLLQRNTLTPPQIGAICVATAGGINTGRGVVVTPSPHLPGWAEVPLADMLKKKFDIDTYIINDASAAALGEHRYGVGKGVANLVLLTLGTGIGGGIVIDSKLYLGTVGGAGELGHMTVDANGPKDGCGNAGCLEILASGSAIEKQAIEHLEKGELSSLATPFKFKVDITVQDIAAAARNGDRLAQDIISRAAFYLGVGLVNITNIFNPELIIIGGGMAELGEMIIAPGRKMVAERAFSVNARSVRIERAALGNEAGIHGAAAFALYMMKGRP